MNATNRNGIFALPRAGSRNKAICVLGGILLTPFLAQGAIVTLNLGLSAQILTETGLGPNGSGLGQWAIAKGACTPSGGNTTCILSGAFSSSTPGLTSGTYSLATTYAGTGSTPLQGTEISVGSDFFTFTAIPSSATMTLTLVYTSGKLVVQIEANSQFPANTGISFLFSTEACSGAHVSICTAAQVSVTPGAIVSGLVTGSASFDTANSVQSNTYYFSDFAYSGGYQTTLTYVNYSPQTVTCTTNFYGDSGAPVALPFASGTVSTRIDTMQPGASVHDQTVANLAPPFVQGWAQATCTGPVGASLLYRFFSGGVAVGEAGVNAETSATTEFATFAQTATGIAYANPSTTQSATVTVEVYSTAGTVLGSHVITLGPLAHGAANVGPLLGLTTFTGVVKITSNIPIVSLSLNAEAFPVFSSLPPGDLPGSTSLVTP